MDRTVALNTFFQFASKGAAGITSLLLVALLTRHLGGELYGLYVVILAWGGVLAVCCDFGLYNTGVRELSLAEGDFRRVAGALLTASMLNTLLWTVLASALLFLLPLSPLFRWGMGVFLCHLAFLAVVNPCRAVFHSRLRMGYIAAGDLAGSAVLLVLAVVCLRAGFGIVAVLAALTLGTAVNFLLLFIAVQRFAKVRWVLDRAVLRDFYLKAFPLGISGLLAVLYARNGVFVISWTNPPQDTGAFGAAHQVYDLISLVPVLFLGVMLPLFSRALQGHEAVEGGRHYGAALRVLVFLAVPVALGGVFLAGPLMELVTGRNFTVERVFELPFLGSVALEGTAATFRVLALVLGLSFLGQLNGHLMVAGRRQSSLLRVYFLSLPVNVLLNLWLIPRYSFLGAAVSLFVSETVALCYTTWFVWRAFKLRPLLTPFCQAALASVPMLAFLWLSGGSVIFLVGLGALVYGAGLLFIVKVSQPLRMRT